MLFRSSSSVPFDPAKDIPDLSHKVILVTGANSGIGAETIIALAKHAPKELWLAARTRTTANATIERAKETAPGANIKLLDLDLSSLEATKTAADTVLAVSERLDVLILNAGIAFTPAGLTTDGYEIQFGTNHMGHALLAKLLMPLMLKTAQQPGSDVRIVSVASHGGAFAPKTIQEVGFWGKTKTEMNDHNTFDRYGISKIANIYFASELAKRYPSIISVSIFPGVVATDLKRGFAVSFPWLSWMWGVTTTLMGVTAEEGAKTQLWASVSKGVRTGASYTPVGKEDPGSALTQNSEVATALWEFTEKELNEKEFGQWPSG